jgi:curved DNA-binding protein CbpA
MVAETLKLFDASFDPYETLGIDRRAADGEVKRAYFALVRQHPPERDPKRFKEIRAAYEKLKSPERRAETDLFLLQPPPGPPRRKSASYDLAVQREDALTLAFELALGELSWHKEFREPQLP